MHAGSGSSFSTEHEYLEFEYDINETQFPYLWTSDLAAQTCLICFRVSELPLGLGKTLAARLTFSILFKWNCVTACMYTWMCEAMCTYNSTSHNVCLLEPDSVRVVLHNHVHVQTALLST